MPDSILILIAEHLIISVPYQSHVLHLGFGAAAGRIKIAQEARRQAGPMKIVDLTGNLLRQRGLRNGIPVIPELFLMVMKHLGYDHILTVRRNRLFAAAACQLPNLSDKRRGRKDLQIEKSLFPASADDFCLTGQRKGFGNENDRIRRAVDFLDEAGDQSRRSCGNNADACHS